MKKTILAAIMVLMISFGIVACSAEDGSDGTNAGTDNNSDSINSNSDNSNSNGTNDQNSMNNPTKGETEEQQTGQNPMDDMVTGGTATEGATTQNAITDDTAADATGTLSILNDVWTTYGEDEKFFALGGDATNPVDNAPGLFSLEDTQNLESLLLVPADAKGMIDEAASLMHSMNANTFTGASFHLTDPANVEAFAEAMNNSIKNTQWVCGSPDQYVIYSVKDEYVVTAFGNIDIMKVFKEKFLAVHGENAEILVEENVAW